MAGDVDHSAGPVWDLLSEPRMAPYVADADGDRAAALALYCWSSRTVAASFEVLGHLEVLVRNALDAVLREHFSEAERGIPWFMLPINENVSAAVETTRGRLREQNRSIAIRSSRGSASASGRGCWGRSTNSSGVSACTARFRTRPGAASKS
ncbi:hypothetical protein [Nocardia farcinica]|uniref:hypothetical protein n=1 Tax=Nocardia farcinica TaxID=37329 RepID=UPI0024560A6D|nr:hypothetical protein [Nocardia farcinica]